MAAPKLKYPIMTLGREDQDKGCTLRIFHLNDVYLLDNFPRIKTLIQTNRGPNQLTKSLLLMNTILAALNEM